jgi:hypothetical protein
MATVEKIVFVSSSCREPNEITRLQTSAARETQSHDSSAKNVKQIDLGIPRSSVLAHLPGKASLLSGLLIARLIA